MIHSKSEQRHQVIINVIMLLVTVIMVAPLLLLFMSSITDEKALLVYGYSFLPKKFSLDAYRYIFTNGSTIFNAYKNTIVVTVIGTAANLIMSSMAAYSLSIKKLPFRNVINFYIFFTMLFNGGLVPSYLMWSSTFHIKNTLWAMILPNFLCSAMNVILMRTYYMTSIPEALYVTVGLFSGLSYWNDWTNGLYYINDTKLYSIQTLLNKMIQDIQAMQANAASASSGAAMSIPTVSVRMAIAIVALLPILVMYPFLQKYFAEGIALGAVKG